MVVERRRWRRRRSPTVKEIVSAESRWSSNPTKKPERISVPRLRFTVYSPPTKRNPYTEVWITDRGVYRVNKNKNNRLNTTTVLWEKYTVRINSKRIHHTVLEKQLCIFRKITAPFRDQVWFRKLKIHKMQEQLKHDRILSIGIYIEHITHNI